MVNTNLSRFMEFWVWNLASNGHFNFNHCREPFVKFTLYTKVTMLLPKIKRSWKRAYPEWFEKLHGMGATKVKIAKESDQIFSSQIYYFWPSHLLLLCSHRNEMHCALETWILSKYRQCVFSICFKIRIVFRNLASALQNIKETKKLWHDYHESQIDINVRL